MNLTLFINTTQKTIIRIVFIFSTILLIACNGNKPNDLEIKQLVIKKINEDLKSKSDEFCRTGRGKNIIEIDGILIPVKKKSVIFFRSGDTVRYRKKVILKFVEGKYIQIDSFKTNKYFARPYSDGSIEWEETYYLSLLPLGKKNLLYPEDYCNDIFFYSLVNPQGTKIGETFNDWEDQIKVHYELDYSSDVFKLVEGNIIHPDDKSLFNYCKYNSFVIVYDRYRKVWH